MTYQSSRLALPYIAPAQAQKHVTHNEAIKRLDHLVQLVLVSLDGVTPPVSPQIGDVHALGANPTGGWVSQGSTLAVRDESGWSFVTPALGWIACMRDTPQVMRFGAAGWEPLALGTNLVDGLGIATAWDDTNRFSIASDASLFSHAGGGHQIKLNKASDSDTASLLFQSDYTGHAEIGLAGEKALSVKVSGDGATWYQAMRVDPVAQTVTLSPAGTPRLRLNDTSLTIEVPVTGAAVQSSPTDTTIGALMPVGAFGLGGLAETSGSVDDYNTSYGYGQSKFIGHTSSSNAPANSPFVGQNGAAGIQIFTEGGARGMQLMAQAQNDATPVKNRIAFRSYDGAWAPWTHLFTNTNILGNVLQTGGVPTGAIIERGSNANGEYMRLADGTQFCTSPILNGGVTVPDGGIYRSNDMIWTYHASFTFVGSGSVSCVNHPNVWGNGTFGSFNSSCRGHSAAPLSGRIFRAFAIGRWY
jgi:hypothetical protein